MLEHQKELRSFSNKDGMRPKYVELDWTSVKKVTPAPFVIVLGLIFTRPGRNVQRESIDGVSKQKESPLLHFWLAGPAYISV